MKIKISELIKFLTIGAIGIIPNFIVYNILTYIIEYFNCVNIYTKNIVWLMGVISGGIFNYISSKKYVFNNN